MKFTFASLVFLLCIFSVQAAWAELKIVATLPDLAALAQEIGGEHVEVSSLSSHREDPHYVDPSPDKIILLNRADLLIFNGLGLEEGWLPPLLVSARNSKIQPNTTGNLNASNFVQLLEIQTNVDRSQGDIHAGGNPHFLHDPRAALRVATSIRDRLVQLDPTHKDGYNARFQSFQLSISKLIKEEREHFATLPLEKRKVITRHRSLVYFLDWLQIQRPLNIEPKPGILPTPQHTALVLKTMRAQGITIILHEDFYPHKTGETLARLSKGKVVLIPGGANFDKGERYQDRFKNVTRSLYDALSR